MITKPGWTISVVTADDSDMAGSDETSAALQKHRTAAIRKIRSAAIKVGAGDLVGASHTHLVGAVCATTTLSPVYEQVVEFVVSSQARRLDGMIPGEVINR